MTFELKCRFDEFSKTSLQCRLQNKVLMNQATNNTREKWSQWMEVSQGHYWGFLNQLSHQGKVWDPLVNKLSKTSQNPFLIIHKKHSFISLDNPITKKKMSPASLKTLRTILHHFFHKTSQLRPYFISSVTSFIYSLHWRNHFRRSKIWRLCKLNGWQFA